jgi:protein-tyrosine phosphatase
LLQTLLNYRDLGGLPTRCGALRDGVLLRGGLYGGLEIAAENYLPAIHVFDLRQESETIGPSPSVCIHRWPIHDQLWRSENRAPEFYVESSVRLIPALAPAIADAIEILASRESVLVCCRLGKDRTGLMVLLLGRLFGADDSSLVSDYLRSSDYFASNRRWVAQYALSRGEDIDGVMARLCPSSDVPQGILDRIPNQQDVLCRILGIEEELVEKALDQSVMTAEHAACRTSRPACEQS